MRLAAIVVVLLAGAARADVGVRVVDAESPVLDGGVWNSTVGIPDATVRVIGERAIFVVHTNAYGQFSITGLPPGIYRIETDRGHLIDLIHVHGPITLTEDRPLCGGPYPVPTFPSALGAAQPPPSPAKRRGHVDTTSTSQGIELDSASLRPLP
jgi:hypothetical protein